MKNTKHNKKHMKKANKLGIKRHESEKKKNFIYKLALISLARSGILFRVCHNYFLLLPPLTALSQLSIRENDR